MKSKATVRSSTTTIRTVLVCPYKLLRYSLESNSTPPRRYTYRYGRPINRYGRYRSTVLPYVHDTRTINILSFSIYRLAPAFITIFHSCLSELNNNKNNLVENKNIAPFQETTQRYEDIWKKKTK